MGLLKEYKSNGDSMNVYLEDKNISLEFDISKMKILTSEETFDFIDLLENHLYSLGYSENYLDNLSLDDITNIEDLKLTDLNGNHLFIQEEDSKLILKLDDITNSEIFILNEISIIKLYKLLI